MYKKKELQLSYFSICEGKKLDDKIVTYFALKTGSTVHVYIIVSVLSKPEAVNFSMGENAGIENDPHHYI